MIITKPKHCNLCGGDVIYTSNAVIYGKEYGSGRCYLCTECGAYVGTHRPYPERAMGILANKEMRAKKRECHDVFDKMWSNGKERSRLYKKLAKEMNMKLEDCHFGYMDIQDLEMALYFIKRW